MVLSLINIKKENKAEISSNEFINLTDVRGTFLYTKDSHIFSYLKVQPISTALMNETEKKTLTERMTRDLSPLGVPFKILFLSRPTDVKQIIDFYEGIKSETSNTKKRDSITKSIKYFSSLSNTGSVLERHTYICLWVNATTKTQEELLSKTLEFADALSRMSIPCSVCKEHEIINMLGLFYNPVYAQEVLYDTTPNFTFIGGGE